MAGHGRFRRSLVPESTRYQAPCCRWSSPLQVRVNHLLTNAPQKLTREGGSPLHPVDCRSCPAGGPFTTSGLFDPQHLDEETRSSSRCQSQRQQSSRPTPAARFAPKGAPSRQCFRSLCPRPTAADRRVATRPPASRHAPRPQAPSCRRSRRPVPTGSPDHWTARSVRAECASESG